MISHANGSAEWHREQRGINTPEQQRIEQLEDKVESYKKLIFSNTNRETTLENRFFTAHENGFIADQNFDFDAGLSVDGDFIDDEKFKYAQMIASALNSVAKADKQVKQLQAELAECKRDAGRYQWLREHTDWFDWDIVVQPYLPADHIAHDYFELKIDCAIDFVMGNFDSAIAAQKGEGK